MIQTTESMTTESPVLDSTLDDKCVLWDSTEVTRKIDGTYLYGSRNRTKMLNFLFDSKFDRDNMRYYLTIPLARQENETFTYYKVRRKFSQALIKYLFFVRQITFTNTITKLQEQKKDADTVQ